MIVMAALLGGLAPFCSCEVIPFIAGLLAVGAPLSAIMAFWLSSPLINPTTVAIIAAALGWEFAVGKAVAAVALGLFGGFGVRLLVWRRAFAAPLRENADTGCGGCCNAVETGKPVWRFWREAPRMKTFHSEVVTNARFLVKWLAFAYLLEALLITYVPADLIAGVVGGDGFTPIVMGALVGAPAYLNGYAAPPIGRWTHGTGYESRCGDGVHGRGVCELHPGHGRRVVARASAGVRRLRGLWHRGCHHERRAVRSVCRVNTASRLTHQPRTARMPSTSSPEDRIRTIILPRAGRTVTVGDNATEKLAVSRVTVRLGRPALGRREVT